MKFKWTLFVWLALLFVAGQSQAGSIEAQNATNITIKMGDNAGSNKVSFTDLDDSEVASINSDGDYDGGLADNTVDNADMADDSVDSAEIADGAVDKIHLSTDAQKVVTNSKSAAYTIGTDDSNESYGGVVYVTSAATMTLPAVADGMSVSVIAVGANAVSVDPNASDLIVLDGTSLDDGDQIDSTNSTGDMAVCQYYSADGWYCTTNGWSDGGQ